MSRRVQLVIVCEDSQHEAFARRFLELAGWEKRQLRVEKAPPGEGSGEQFVRLRYPLELQEYRANAHRVSRGLIAITDGDRDGLEQRRAKLDQACRESDLEVRTSEEPVAIFIPTWNIETWLAYLLGETVDESRSDYPRLPRARDCQPMVETLFLMCQANELRLPAPPSLVDACREWTRLLR